MSIITRRLGGSVAFDEDSERFIVEKIDKLSRSRDLTGYLNVLLKLAFENPEIINKNDALIARLTEIGGTPCAKEFYDEGRLEILEMKKKINAMYDMCLKMYTLYEFGKQLGLEDGTKNMAQAQFMCERQLTEMCNNLGLKDTEPFESAKIPKMESKSADVLEYILSHYDGVVSEVVANNIATSRVSSPETQIVPTRSSLLDGGMKQAAPDIERAEPRREEPRREEPRREMPRREEPRREVDVEREPVVITDEVETMHMSTPSKTPAPKVQHQKVKKQSIYEETEDDEEIDFGEAFAKNAELDDLDEFFGGK